VSSVPEAASRGGSLQLVRRVMHSSAGDKAQGGSDFSEIRAVRRQPGLLKAALPYLHAISLRGPAGGVRCGGPCLTHVLLGKPSLERRSFSRRAFRAGPVPRLSRAPCDLTSRAFRSREQGTQAWLPGRGSAAGAADCRTCRQQGMTDAGWPGSLGMTACADGTARLLTDVQLH